MTATSRRTLLKASAVGVAGAATLAVPGAAQAAPRSLYRRRRFVPLLQRRFRLMDGRRGWTVRLTGVENLSSATRGDERSFALTFRTTAGGPPQGSYVLRRRGFTPTTLFVVPGDMSCTSYRAVVNCAPHQKT